MGKLRRIPTVADIDKLYKSGDKLKLNKALEARYEKIKNRFETVGFGNFIGIHCVELAQGMARLEVKGRNDLSNWNGVIDGGVTAAMLDKSCAVAIATLIDFEEQKFVTFHLDVDYVEPAEIDSVLLAEAFVSKIDTDETPVLIVPRGGKRLIHMHVRIFSRGKGYEYEVVSGTAWFQVYGRRRKTRSI